MSRAKAALAALLVGLLALGGSALAAPAKKKPAKVAYITYSYFTFQIAIKQGLVDVVRPAGGLVKVFNANFDPQKLQQQCTDAVQSKRFNAIVLGPLDSASALPCVRTAKNAKIPVVTVESPVGKNANALKPQISGVVGAIVLTPRANAVLSADLVKRACVGKRPCKVIAEETLGSPFSIAVHNAVEKLPGVEIVQTLNTQYDQAKTAAMLPDALARNPDANVFMSNNDDAAVISDDIVKRARVKDKTFKIIGVGGNFRSVDAIKKGTLFGTLGSWPRKMGRAAGKMANSAVNGQRIARPGLDATKLSKPAVVVKTNVDQFKPEWGAK